MTISPPAVRWPPPLAVAVAIALASIGAYVAVRAKLRGEVDSSASSAPRWRR